MTATDDLVDIFRVQHRKSGEGPYTVDDLDTVSEGIREMHFEHGGWNGHPNANGDPGLGPGIRRPEHYFGFTKREQLAQWFEGYIEALHRDGFIVATYRVEPTRVIDGSAQALFEREHAIFFSSTPITSFCKGLPA